MKNQSLPPLTPEPAAGRPSPPFRTENLDFAAALLASRDLRYLRTEPSGDGRVCFAFLDSEGRGPALEIDYASGRFTPLDPAALFRCKGVLQDSLRNVRNGYERQTAYLQSRGARG